MHLQWCFAQNGYLQLTAQQHFSSQSVYYGTAAVSCIEKYDSVTITLSICHLPDVCFVLGPYFGTKL